ncbi:hypothetical protein MBLNU459_g2709t1 [Dothideomycetes sp. NU459]
MTIVNHDPIKTPRLLLRRVTFEDAEPMLSFLSLASVLKYTKRKPLVSVSEAQDYLAERTGPDAYNFAVTLADSGAVIGILGSKAFPEIGYLFHPAYARQGYATEALRAYVQRMFEVMPSCAAGAAQDPPVEGFDLARAFCDVENAPSINLLLRCGFTRGEVIERDYESGILGWRDGVCLRIARPGMRLEDVMRADPTA